MPPFLYYFIYSFARMYSNVVKFIDMLSARIKWHNKIGYKLDHKYENNGEHSKKIVQSIYFAELE